MHLAKVKFPKINKKFILFFSLVFFGLLSPSGLAQAFSFNPVVWAIEGVNAILVALLALVSVVLGWAGSLLNFSLNPGLEFANANMVQVGWPIALSVANLFFIIVLLIIAFATILGVEEYNLKKLLGKFIMAALLVNFSLAIAGTLVDFSQVLASYFLEPLKNSAEAIGDLIKVQNIFNPEALPGSSDFDSAVLRFTGNTISIGFSLVVIYVFIIIGISFLYRMAMIWVLLIASPIAWICWVLPATKKVWDRWWDDFFCYLFFPTATGILLYITIAGFGPMINGIVSVPEGTEFGLATKLLTQLTQAIILVILLLKSIDIGEKMGCGMSKGVTGFAKGVAGRVSGATVAGRYKDAFKGRRKKIEEEKKDMAKKQFGKIAKHIPGLQSYKEREENKEKTAEKRLGSFYKELSDPKLTDKQRQDMVNKKRDELRNGVGRWKKRFIPFARQDAAMSAIQLSQLEKSREIQVEATDEWPGETGEERKIDIKPTPLGKEDREKRKKETAWADESHNIYMNRKSAKEEAMEHLEHALHEEAEAKHKEKEGGGGGGGAPKGGEEPHHG